ncbi:zinc-binding dehydrogenase [Mesorhizobium qingshengii]|uniref:Zinc-binding dehydrogenase n=1 Tax=Mesorhizobium qingshengii TaxID=1165689 RepID=A0ABT4QZU0_9HYPH|nr:zinc-binding dehydrogenase [Mesorhizobium qingshengii]MCZ8547094.1 zinc-binding dehydrogenase [Mesorhizobium qingshengii]
MLALTVCSDNAARLKLAEVDEPRPCANEALISVHATSLNRGELRLLTIRPNGWMPGQDVVGIVERAAADGSGPAVGTRVVALVGEAGWAERVAVPTDRLAVLPDRVSFISAATLPVAGTTALRTLRHGGDLAGQQVLITGASGAVGRFQVQIAREQGASVTAIAATRHAEDLRRLGAGQVVESIELAEGAFSLITESVGGQSLAHAIERVAPGGTIVMFGSSSGELTPIGFRQFVPGHEGARLQTFAYYTSGSGIGADIASLLALVAAGRLETRVALTAPWTDIAQALHALRERSFSGKAVLTMGSAALPDGRERSDRAISERVLSL